MDITSYTLEYSDKDLGSDFPNNNVSGCTWNPSTNRLFIISNDSQTLCEYSIAADGNPTKTRTISLTNGWDDTEDICYMFDTGGANHQARFAITEEATSGNSRVVEVYIDDNTTSLHRTNDKIVEYDTGISAGITGTGIEGIDYDSGRDCFYLAQEMNEVDTTYCGSIYKLVRGTGAVTELIDGATKLNSYIKTCNAVHYDSHSDHLIIGSGNAAKTPSKRAIEVELDGDYIGVKIYEDTPAQPEGLCFNGDMSKMWVVGENREYYYYEGTSDGASASSSPSASPSASASASPSASPSSSPSSSMAPVSYTLAADYITMGEGIGLTLGADLVSCAFELSYSLAADLISFAYQCISYSKISKPATSYSKITKHATDYDKIGKVPICN